MKPKDAALEGQIYGAWLKFMCAESQDLQRAALADMTALVKQRSPERVQEMERERGLLV